MKIIKVENPQEKSRICERVLRSLPQWFGIESAILDYIKDVQGMETWAAVESDVIGFISLNKHNLQTAEIYVMGLLPEYHGKKIGREMIRSAEENLILQGFKFLTVKTLSESRHDENYDKTRRFYLKYGFTPIEEFKTLWGEHNPCLMMIKNLPSHCYAVIFTSKRTEEDQAGYENVAQRMLELAQKQKGFISAESIRDSEGLGITVSYWRAAEDIKNWKAHSEHLLAQEAGRSKWYESFTTRICRVEREYRFSRGDSP
ncbi:MAG: GNAT family N-acetyltransferase [Pseudobdellovibrionaceae bacterium]